MKKTPTTRLTSATAPSTADRYRSGLLCTLQLRIAVMLPAANASIAKSWCSVICVPGKIPTPRMPTPSSPAGIVIAHLLRARCRQYAAMMTSSPVTIIVQLKMAADGCRIRLCGRMAARSLTVLRWVL
jgi:hypothetical protein